MLVWYSLCLQQQLIRRHKHFAGLGRHTVFCIVYSSDQRHLKSLCSSSFSCDFASCISFLLTLASFGNFVRLFLALVPAALLPFSANLSLLSLYSSNKVNNCWACSTHNYFSLVLFYYYFTSKSSKITKPPLS